MREIKWMAGPLGGADVGMLAAMAALSLALCAAGPSAISALRPAAPAMAAPARPLPHAPALAKLPIEVEAGEGRMRLASRLVGKDAFMALALSVEDVPAKAYVDASGANAGAGYGVDARRRAHGEEMVKADLRLAGFSEKAIGDLLSRDPAKIEAVDVDCKQALRLLSISKPRFEAMAREALGAKAFDALPAHKQDVLSYLAYNTGGPGKFVKLLGAVKARDDAAALEQLAPSVRAGKGRHKVNERLRAWAQAAWVGPEELARALSAPADFERAYAKASGQGKFIADMGYMAAKLAKRKGSKQAEPALAEQRRAKPKGLGRA